MAVKTTFTTSDFERILTRYNLGEYVESHPFEKGADQTNLLLITSRQQVVLRYYEKRSLDYIEFEIELLHCLTEHAYPCPAPIANKQGAYVDLYKDKPVTLFTFLPGEHSDKPDNYLQIAKAIGWLHKLTDGYRPKGGQTRPVYDQAYCWSWTQATAKHVTSDVEAQERLAWIKQQLDALALPDTLPKGVCHGDTNPSNFLYEQGQLTAVLDFDQASYTYLLYDVAQMLYWLTWPNKGDLDIGRSRKLLAQYEVQRPMTAEEEFHLFDALKLVILIGISWSLDDDAGYANAKRKVESINTYTRETFRGELCSSLSVQP